MGGNVMLRRIFLTGLVIVITAPLTIFAADETVLMRAQELVDVFQREIGKPISEQSSSAFIEIKKRLEPLWNPLGNLALHDPAAAALKERLYEVSAGAEQRIGELRKLEAERERAELMRLALERQQ